MKFRLVTVEVGRAWKLRGHVLCFGNALFNKDDGGQRETSGFSIKIRKLVTHVFIQFIDKMPFTWQVPCKVLASIYVCQPPRFKYFHRESAPSSRILPK